LNLILKRSITTGTETTYTSNSPKLAQGAIGAVTAKIASTAHGVASDFQQAASSLFIKSLLFYPF
jgi:hypothetical protein